MRLVQDAIGTILNADPNHPFHLGTVNVNVTAQDTQVSALSDVITQTEFAEHNEFNAASAMEYLPGVSATHSYSGRNQQQISVHGFGYLQVPVFVDGILINDPYDGTLDFREIPTTDIAEIQISKGFSSALIGPDALGGAINVVTKEPQKKYEGEMLIGGYTGDGFLSSIRLGTRWNHYFAEGSLDWMQDNYIPLSGNFITNIAQPGDALNNSYMHNAKYTGRFGWTPDSKSEYVFTYLNQKANSGIPVSAGNDPWDATNCSNYALGKLTSPYSCYTSAMGTPFRSWQFWDRTAYYFNSLTALGSKSTFKTRVFYDQFPNLMNFYNVSSSITGPPVYNSSELNLGYITLYDDHSDGFTAQFDTSLVRRNALSASFYFKDDTHHEIPISPSGIPTKSYVTGVPGAYAAGITSYRDRFQTASIGLQDVISITENLTGTVGISLDHIDGLRAANSSTYYAFVYPQCPSNPATAAGLLNYQACTPHQWAYNPMATIAYSFEDSGRVFFGFSQKSRFPVMKDMYSFKMGKGIPNPQLQSESSDNFEVGYSRNFPAHTSAQLEYFYSRLRNAIESLSSAPLNLCNEYPAGTCSSQASCSIDMNATQESHQGAEFTVHTAPIKNLTFDANYTYVNKEIDGFTDVGATNPGPCYNGDYLANGTGSLANTSTTAIDNSCLTPTDLPKNKAVATVNWVLPFKASLNSTLRYEGGNKAIDSYKAKYFNGLPTASYYYYEGPVSLSHFATWDLGGSLYFYKDVALQVGVKNLLNRNYFETLDIPEEGRNCFANMRVRF
jgi:iron complex outermembrane receptor protein